MIMILFIHVFQSPEFFQGKFDILVTQTVDQRIQHGNNAGIKHRGHFPLIHGAHR